MLLDILIKKFPPPKAVVPPPAPAPATQNNANSEVNKEEVKTEVKDVKTENKTENATGLKREASSSNLGNLNAKKSKLS